MYVLLMHAVCTIYVCSFVCLQFSGVVSMTTLRSLPHCLMLVLFTYMSSSGITVYNITFTHDVILLQKALWFLKKEYFSRRIRKN